MSWKKKYEENWGRLGMRYKTYTMEDALEAIIDYRGKTPKKSEKGIPTLSAKSVKNNHIDYDSCYYISSDEYKRFMVRGLPQIGDVLLTTEAPLGMVAQLDRNDVGIAQRLLTLRGKQGILDNEYLLYYLQSPIGQALLRARETGTTVTGIKQSEFRKIQIDIPDIENQRKIGGILRGLDDKIAVNNSINKNLEQQALALFKQYFMDYVPYGGVAPAEWREVSLDDVCTKITDGSHYSPTDSPDSPYPMYSVKDMETYGFNSSSCKHITKEDFCKLQKNDCIPLLNDILVAKDGSYLKEIFICSEQKDEAILSSIAIFRPDTQIILPEILLYLLKQPSVRKDVGDNYVSGSALPRIVLKDFKKYRFMLPTVEEQKKIGSVLHAIRIQIKTNVYEIHSLSFLRDALLPKLMSGELDVSAIDL